MFTLDSDLLGLLMALLTFLVPLISTLVEKRKKKRKGETSAPTEEEEEFEPEEILKNFLPDEFFHSGEKPAPEVVEEEIPYREESECEEVFNDILDKEGEAATMQVEEPAAPAADEILKEVPQSGGDLKKRIKENPKDMVVFAEILKPKFKEY